MIMITMRRNLGSILTMTTTISSITMDMKKEQGKVPLYNQKYRGQCELVAGTEEICGGGIIVCSRLLFPWKEGGRVGMR